MFAKKIKGHIMQLHLIIVYKTNTSLISAVNGTNGEHKVEIKLKEANKERLHDISKYVIGQSPLYRRPAVSTPCV